MKRLLLILITFFLFITHQGLAQQTPGTKTFGVIDTADLRMTRCDFERDANAMVLFDKAEVTVTLDSIVMWRHTRIKIFKDAAKELANVRLAFQSYRNFENVTLISAQATRVENNNIIVSPVDPKLIYTEVTDKHNKALVFTFPDVRPGSVIEYRYKWKTTSPVNFPAWFFQGSYPVLYSEITAAISDKLKYNVIRRGYQEFVRETSEEIPGTKKGHEMRKFYWAKARVNSFVKEPYVTPGNMNLQCLMFRLTAIKNEIYGYTEAPDNTWYKIASRVIEDEDFGGQLIYFLDDEELLLEKALKLHTVDEKIAFLFDEVKKRMSWNKLDKWYATTGVRKAWVKKTGNSTEINLAVYMLLKKAGVTAYPMLVSTHDNDPISPDYAGFSFINKTVTYVPVDSTHRYVLDATSKYHRYDEIPADLLNTYGVQIEQRKNITVARPIFLENNNPALKAVMVNAEIKTDSKVSGSVVISNYSYFRDNTKKDYDLLGPEKYLKSRQEESNILKITEPKFDNMETDTLPLIERFNFNEELSGSDENYIYFNPNLFSPLKTNPFLSERRTSDIDFGNCTLFNINGTYQLPKGYKVEALPNGAILSMEDKSIIFKRRVNQQDGTLLINYSAVYRRSVFSVDEYPAIRDFYKRMFEMLNEMVVLKKE